MVILAWRETRTIDVHSNERRPVSGTMGSDMTPKIMQRIRLVWGIVTAALIVVAGGALIYACLSIYTAPGGVYSRATVARAFGRISLFVWAAVGALAVNIVLSLISCDAKARPAAVRDETATLQRLTDGYDLNAVSSESKAAIARERGLRRKLTVATVVSCVVPAIPFIVWLFLPDSFGTGEKNREILVAALILLGCTLVAMTASFIIGMLVRASIARERDVVKAAIADRSAPRRKDGAGRRPSCMDKPAVLWTVRGVILVAAVVFIVLGVLNNGMYDVLGKAKQICSECIGLG